MIYFLYGPDSYRRNQKLKSSLDGYRKKYPTGDIMAVDLEENPDDWTKARDFLNQPSMFVDSKVLIVKESGDVPEKEEKNWIKVLKSELETAHTFIFVSNAKKPLKAFEFLLKPPAKSDFFGELDGGLLEAFVKKEAATRGLEFEKSAWDFLLNCLSSVAERSWVAVAELEKISLSGFSQPIKSSDLKKIISPVLDDQVFEAARKISWSRSWAEKLGLLESLFLQKKEAAYIFNSLAYIAKGKDIVRMADYDVAVKSGNLEYEEALLDFVLSA
ncbi:MAG: hypothetical protein AAB700_00980 [Patescibacteria group bacterium]